MQLINKNTVKYDPSLLIVTMLTKDMGEYTEMVNYCAKNSILYDMEHEVKPSGATDLLSMIRSRRSKGNILLTMRIKGEQLTEIILHFG